MENTKEKSIKKRRNIGTLLIAIGAVLFVAGWLMGARGVNMDIGWYDGKFQVMTTLETIDIPIHEIITDIQITSRSARIEIIGHSGNETSVSFVGVEANFDINNNTLVIRNDRSMFNIVNTARPIIRLNLPNNRIYKLDVQSSNGRITANDLSFENINLRNSSGGIRLNNIIADNAVLHASSGSIRLDNILLHDTNINVSSGSMRINNAVVTGLFDGTSSSGSITGEGIKLELQSNMNLQATSGSVTISLLNSDVLYNLNSRSGSRRVNGNRHTANTSILPIANENLPTITINTSSGSIRLNTGSF